MLFGPPVPGGEPPWARLSTMTYVWIGTVLWVVLAVVVAVVGFRRFRRPQCPDCGLSVDRDLRECPSLRRGDALSRSR